MPKWVWIAIIVFVVTAAGVVFFRPSSYPIVNGESNGRNIIAFGDSLTAGTGRPRGRTTRRSCRNCSAPRS